MSIDIDIDEITEVFIEESLEGLDIMEHGLLNLDIGAADPETMNAIFRAAHSIKGGGATFGFTEISEFAHDLETLLDEMRQGERPVTREGVDLTLQSVDCLRAMIRALATGEDLSGEAATLRAALAAMLADGNNVGVASAEAPAATSAEPTEAPIIGWTISFTPKPELFVRGNDPSAIFAELQRISSTEVTCAGFDEVDFESLDPTRCTLRWDIVLYDGVEREQIDEVFSWAIDDCELIVEPVLGEVPTPVAPVSSTEPAAVAAAPAADKLAATSAPKVKAKGSGGESSSIRVNIDKVDNLINLVGELVITQSMLSRFNGDFDFTQLPALREGLAQLSRNTRELQDSVMAIRAQPVRSLFQRMTRIVREAAQMTAKDVVLETDGETTEIDKTVVERLADPLTHMIRNAIDHGLEGPDDRVAQGKPRTGQVRLTARQQSDRVVIEVSDDGRGIDRARVLERAIDRGLVPANKSLEPAEIDRLLFLPGFSTATDVSALSGRGVGMDVVQRAIRDLNGTVSITSAEGAGTTFSVSLPLTLAILDGMIVRSAAQRMVIPLSAIVETQTVAAARVEMLGPKQSVVQLHDRFVPLMDLAEGMGFTPSQTIAEDEDDSALLFVQSEDQAPFALRVDAIEAQRQVVIKGLSESFGRVPCVSAATILGDGQVALIVDLGGLASTVGLPNSARQANFSTEGSMLQ